MTALNLLTIAVFSAGALLAFTEALGLVPTPGKGTAFAGREAAALHALMNASMAVMATAFYSPWWQFSINVSFALAGATIFARLFFLAVTRRGTLGERSGLVYHLMSVAAMFYALTLMPTGHAAHGVESQIEVFKTGWIALTLAAVFTLDAVLTMCLAAGMPERILQLEEQQRAISAQDITALRFAAVPHVIMDIGMAIMLTAPMALMAMPAQVYQPHH